MGRNVTWMTRTLNMESMRAIQRFNFVEGLKPHAEEE